MIRLTKKEIDDLESSSKEIRKALEHIEATRCRRGEAEGFVEEVESAMGDLNEAAYTDYDAALTAVAKNEQLNRASRAVAALSAEEAKVDEQIRYLACQAGGKLDRIIRPFTKNLEEEAKKRLTPILGAHKAHAEARTSRELRGCLSLLTRVTTGMRESRNTGESLAEFILPVLKKAITAPNELPGQFSPKD
jgi:hypothetical protein